MPSLSAWLNPYGDLQTSDASEFAVAPTAFAVQLDALLSRGDAQRGVWVRLPWARAELLPALAARGFKPHHWAHGDAHLVLHAWRRDGPNPTPLYSFTDVGCGALVVNAAGAVLGVCERFDASGRMNPPGGHLDEGEDLLSCAAREAREEAGVDAVALGLACLHEKAMPWALPAGAPPADAATRGAQEHAARWGTLHHGFWVLCAARSDALTPDPAEVTRAEWLPRERWAASFSPWVLAMLRAAEASGQIAAAAAAAAALRGGATGPFCVPALLGASAVELANKYGAPHPHHFYHAQPLALFADAAGGVAGCKGGAPSVRALGWADPGLLLPLRAPSGARAPALLAAAALLVGAALGFGAAALRRK
jgi:8-oxo-dGTP pyrophosphatase MutT (NUDIX family)